MVHDAVIIGGGPAGLSAATWLGRHRRTAVLVDAGEHRNRWVDHAHGYLGLDPLDPRELLERARDCLRMYDTVEVVRSRVTTVERDGPDGTFAVATDAAGTISAQRLVLATGVVDAFPEVDNFFEHYGADVFHCPACDGFEARDKHVVVFGWGPQVPGFALGMLNWASAVTVVTDGRELEAGRGPRDRLSAAGVTVVEDEAVELCGTRGALRAVRMRSGIELRCDLAFFTIARHPVTDVARALGCELDAEGYVSVDEDGCTSVRGVYAAGDITPGVQLIQVAAAKGTVAGVACARSF